VNFKLITNFKMFERKIYSNTKIDYLPQENKNFYNNLKFKVGDSVRLKGMGQKIFIIDWIDIPQKIWEIANIIYHIQYYRLKDNKFLNIGLYKDSELVKLSDKEKIALKYNL